MPRPLLATKCEEQGLLDAGRDFRLVALEAADAAPGHADPRPASLSASHTETGRHRVRGWLARFACVAAGTGFVAVSLRGVGQARPEHVDSARISTLESQPKCTVGRNNCNVTKCCDGFGLVCFEQQPGLYAQCRESCTPGPDPTHWDGHPWTCKELGERSEGEQSCAGPGADCTLSRCCSTSGYQCFSKTQYYAACKVSCAPGGPDFMDTDGSPWSCRELGERSPGVQPWVAEKCSGGWENCLQSQCCKDAGQRCYKQNDYYATCRPEGSCPKDQWSCETLGGPTPVTPMSGGKLSPWVFDQCSKKDQDCAKSRCCLGMDLQCYEKDKYYAQCRRTCTPGKNPMDHNETWSCKELGPRSYGLAVKGFPSMYCFSVLRIGSYEEGLLQSQIKRGTGITQCDHFGLYTADSNKSIEGVQTVTFSGAPIVQSVDNTAGNTRLFINAWRQVVADGQWAQHSFTVKADPDAVFLPERLRWHLADFVGKKMFIVNCPLWNMIYGALEVFSFSAVEEWASRGDQCASPDNIGEDKYMTNCMDFLHVMRVRDDTVLGDMLCHTFTTCENDRNVAYHPFKDVGSWNQCWDQAHKSAQGGR